MWRKHKNTAPLKEQSGAGRGEEHVYREQASFIVVAKKPHIRVWLVLSILVLLVVGSIYLKKTTDDNKIVLQVGSYHYTQKQYNELTKEAAAAGHISEEKVKRSLVESMAARAAADKLGLGYPTDRATQDNAARALYDLKLDSAVSDYQRATSWGTVIDPYLAVSELGGFKTAAVFFPFSRYITGFQKTYLTDSFDEKLVGNKQAIQQDISYARQQAEGAIEAYMSKSKTIDQIISEVLANPRFRSYGLTANKSGIDLVGTDQQRYTGNRSVLLRSEYYKNVEKSAKSSGKPEIYEDRIYENFSFNIPEIDRPDDETVVAYYFLVTEPIKQRPGIVLQYQKIEKEYSDAAL